MKQRNFKEIYDKIYQNCGEIVEKKRKEALKKTILGFLVTGAIWALVIVAGISRFAVLFILIFLATAIFLIIYIAKITKEYKRYFKENVINEIVKQSNPSFKYNANIGISSTDYARGEFDRGWDTYSSEDEIDGTLEDGSLLKMSQVHTQERHESVDSQGHTQTTYVTTFLGLYGMIKLKTPTRAQFAILNNSAFSKFNKNRIEMESAEFEKYYDVFSGSRDNGIRQNAMEILTPEAIEELVKIRNIFKTILNIKVDRDMIYFRIDVGDIFEPPTFKSSVNYNMLEKYFLIIDVPRMIYELLIDNIIIMYGNQEDREKRNLANKNEV